MTALVLVSHSRAAAEGTAEIARQMAPDVVLLPAGGIDGGVGTSFELVLAAVEEATAGGSGAVVLTDLGSAVLTTESVLEMLDEAVAARVRVPDAPFVEGAVAAAVEAQSGADVEAVARAAVRAGGSFAGSAGAHATPPAPGEEVASAGAGDVGPALRERVVLGNRLGLHARPAALLARTVADRDARVTVNGVDAASVLELMGLGAVGGSELELVVTGRDAQDTLTTVRAMIQDGFGET
ncbi:dihydroxyacetone kinase phosphoryl donor subunit DhaM [Actinotalea sp. K2]|uniref:dihydroxyacetone kinase phosphoryl donor subunit DhaM n=1 Tax=Actinotalea sp. K2 TaxID=2939438 RepID=UPI00201749B4|nr:dihydroxyacetone kinase phosphoryl donor subunit DhaM [Actinotalea sp. K2]MCL3860259.1 dihydroxyacetone kinase phosphoryl donor subunit DhaM [Actinotalea sp. K2]